MKTTEITAEAIQGTAPASLSMATPATQPPGEQPLSPVARSYGGAVRTEVQDLTPPRSHTPPASHIGRTLRLTPASEIRPQRVTWLWEDRIPAGEITLTAGLGGIGKSTYHAWMVSEVTQGRLPGVYHGTPKSAIICASEDSWERTIVPRLIAAGADLDRVYRVDVVEAEENVRLILPADIDMLADEIQRNDVALLSLDPLMPLISNTIDTHKDAEVRRALEPLSGLADLTACAVLGNAHFNKGMRADPMMRLTGSAAFGQVVRAVLAFAHDPDSDTSVISQAKNNLGHLDLPSLCYHIESIEVETDDGPTPVGRLTLSGESEKSVQDILGDHGNGNVGSARGEAERFLRELLKNGPVSAKSAQDQAADAGISPKALRTAREKICDVNKGGMAEGWHWTLKCEDAPSASKMTAPHCGASSAPSGASSAVFVEGRI